MKRIFWGLTCLVLCVAMSSSALTPTASAATTPSEGFNIITSPLPIKLMTKPGQTVETELRMKNQGSQPETIKVGLMKFGATGDTGQPNLFDITSKDTYASWVHFSPSQFVAEPGVWKSVKMTINVPNDAALGYYLAVTFSRASQQSDSKAATYKGAVATLVLLDVDSANAKRQIQLVSFESTHGLYEYLPATFNIKVRNEGNIFLSPSGNIFISQRGKTVDTLNVNEAGGSVLPKSNRVFVVKWNNGFPVFEDKIVNGKPVPGKHGLEQSLKWDGKNIGKFRIGRYNAKLLMVYDNGKQDVPIEATLNFWVIPWKILLVVIAILALLGYGLYNVLKSTYSKTKGGVSKIRRAKK